MGGGTAHRIETGIDAGAAALFAGAVLFSTAKLGLPVLLAAGWALLSFIACFKILLSLDPRRGGFALRPFAPAALQFDPAELLLEDSASDSRVVRLFGPSAAAPAARPDDSEALLEALEQLRRSFHNR